MTNEIVIDFFQVTEQRICLSEEPVSFFSTYQPFVKYRLEKYINEIAHEKNMEPISSSVVSVTPHGENVTVIVMVMFRKPAR